MIQQYQFSTLRERDMDLLFLEEIGSDPGFAKLIVNQTKWVGRDFTVDSIELSHTETNLGESDITVILTIENAKCAILIEDKIDAPAMPRQYQRYVERGKLAVESGVYTDFDICILCPEKYYHQNEEAQKYDHFISYEMCAGYFEIAPSPIHSIHHAQIQAAILKAKKPPSVTLNENANAFFIAYKAFQKAHYPALDLRSKDTSNGWWTQYSVHFGKMYILHKMQEGYVDLTIPNVGNQMPILNVVASYARKHGISAIQAVQTGKSGTLRIEVPQLRVKEPFEDTPETDLYACFDAITALSEIAAFWDMGKRFSDM